MSQDRVRRPVNAFMLWAKTERKKLAKELATDDNPALSKILGQRWKEMPKDQKRLYMIEAEVLRQQHVQQYPDFKYGKKKAAVARPSPTGAPPNSPIEPAPKSCNNQAEPIVQAQQVVIDVPQIPGEYWNGTYAVAPEVTAQNQVVYVQMDPTMNAAVEPVTPPPPIIAAAPLQNSSYQYTTTTTTNQPNLYSMLTMNNSFDQSLMDSFEAYTPAMDLLDTSTGLLSPCDPYLEAWANRAPTPAYMPGGWDDMPVEAGLQFGAMPQQVHHGDHIMNMGMGERSLASLLAPLRDW